MRPFAKFTEAFEQFLRHEGVKPLMLPPRSPNVNAYCKRFVRSIKEEALSRMIFIGEGSLRYAILNDKQLIECFSQTRGIMIETAYKHIILNENNVAMIDGTRTKVIELVLDAQAYGWSPEELQFQHPTFTMGQIHSALAYYWDHQDELDAEIERRWQEMKQLQQNRELSPLEKRLKARKM